MRHLLKNTQRLRNITVRKNRIGTAEAFEIKQWDALVSKAESRLQQTILQRDNAWRKLTRTVNIDFTTPIPSPAELNTKEPTGLDVKKDLELAYRTRPDFKSIQLKKTKCAEGIPNSQKPTLTLSYPGLYIYWPRF